MPLLVPPLGVVEYADISQWQTSFDPGGYFASGYSKVSIRATYGTTGADPLFHDRWEACAGHTRQSYHFAYPGDGKGEADWHLAQVNAAGGYHPGDEVMLDLEQLGATPAQAALLAPRFLEEIGAAAPQVRRLVYGNEWFLAAAGLTQANLPNVGLIIAAYPGPPLTPPGWDHVCVHQYASNKTVPGFPAPVDINRIICPTGLAHLTYQDGDDMSQADVDAINAHNNQLALTIVGAIVGAKQNSDGSWPHNLAQLALGIVSGYNNTKTTLGTLPAAVSSAIVEHLPNVTVDQAALEAAVATAIDQHLSGATITLTPKAAS